MKFIILLFALLSCNIPSLKAQESSFNGKIFDISSKAHLADVSVKIVSLDNVNSYMTSTNLAGEYFIEDVLSGKYNTYYSKPGYQTHVVHHIEIKPSRHVYQDVYMETQGRKTRRKKNRKR